MQIQIPEVTGYIDTVSSRTVSVAIFNQAVHSFKVYKELNKQLQKHLPCTPSLFFPGPELFTPLKGKATNTTSLLAGLLNEFFWVMALITEVFVTFEVLLHDSVCKIN
jgi:hypothetical protein